MFFFRNIYLSQYSDIPIFYSIGFIIFTFRSMVQFDLICESVMWQKSSHLFSNMDIHLLQCYCLKRLFLPLTHIELLWYIGKKTNDLPHKNILSIVMRHYHPQFAVTMSANEGTNIATKLHKHSCSSQDSTPARRPSSYSVLQEPALSSGFKNPQTPWGFWNSRTKITLRVMQRLLLQSCLKFLQPFKKYRLHSQILTVFVFMNNFKRHKIIAQYYSFHLSCKQNEVLRTVVNPRTHILVSSRTKTQISCQVQGCSLCSFHKNIVQSSHKHQILCII